MDYFFCQGSRTGVYEGVKVNGLIRKGVQFLKSADEEVQ